MAGAVDEALRSAKIAPKHIAAATLARKYAEAIDAARGGGDGGQALADLGPKLLATLTALGLTVAAKHATGKGTPDDPKSPRGVLRQLRDDATGP
jgi:hypothetical protein